MQYAATFLIVATAASLLGCGKSEEMPAPAEPPAVAAPQAEQPAPLAETAPAMQAEVSPAQPEVPPAPPAAASTPTPAKPAAPEPAAEAAPAAPSPDLARGEQIYRQACAFCHDRGVAGAPKTGDAAAWSARLAQGMDTLYTVALRGKGAMPAKGGNPALADADVSAAVDYMVARLR